MYNGAALAHSLIQIWDQKEINIKQSETDQIIKLFWSILLLF